MKNSKLISLGLSLSLVAFMSTGCSDDGDDAVSLDPAPTELKGTWISDCDVPNPGNNESYIYKVEVSDGKIIYTEQGYYSDETCTLLEELFVVTNVATYGEGHTLSTVSGTVYDIDFTDATLSVTPITADKATSFNAENAGSGICGYTDWTAGVSKNLSTNCGVAADVLKVEEATEDFYSIAGIQSDKLHTGDEDADVNLDGSTAAKRPVTLVVNGMTKQ